MISPTPWRADRFMVRDANNDVVARCDTLEDAILIAAAPELLDAVRTCLKAERERRKKLLPGAPATTYTERRIDQIEAALDRLQPRGKTL